ncbi:GNAT family N-acetyltransferase [Bradyrhizobium guangdongense]|uniref:GNAT family N-acetyltransferase n=1 Tax=Bradyrhizobium guangdongense TaxID=1325090 RepID=A0A410V0H1_9BRAD|nr:GNAT family N-acetyltransferase [Bradyrhizobium guangdongense]QAU37162.1 GNAT family N-acetyltransferase [Bradyrhizobium guangdongense]QOZ58217.1 GNAT family N-acetyltransferase [Bradyrhizobium guangdongense]GGI20997.1 N-acetyltransferase GCN5 [Bradyrhizobium guangdongense]
MSDAPAIEVAAPMFGWARAASAGCRFRRIAETDLPFLARVYASTRTEELAPVPWSQAVKDAFLSQQFQAQHVHYQQHYPDADWLIIEHGGTDIGRLYVERWPSQYRIIDIALLPEHRGKGLGQALLRDLLDDAARARKDVSIHVEKFNPAMRLYRRLGFVIEEDKGVYDLMRWRAPAAAAD